MKPHWNRHEQQFHIPEDFPKMSIQDLSKFTHSYRIFVTNGAVTGLLISYNEGKKEQGEVLVGILGGEKERWNASDVRFSSAENKAGVSGPPDFGPES